jgi:hypothetical protein
MHGGLPSGWQITSARASGTVSRKTTQKCGIGDSRSFPLPASVGPFEGVDKWREAVAKPLIMAAPTLADVAWKRAKVKSGDFDGCRSLTLARAEQAIADDLAFLAAHPTRRSNSEAMARSREFKEAMRQRIRKIAVFRDLSGEQVKPAFLSTITSSSCSSRSWASIGAGCWKALGASSRTTPSS